MADMTPSALANMIMGKLYNVLTSGDETVPKSDDNFFTWCTPGMPVDAADFDFLSTGLTGMPSKEQIEGLRAAQAPVKPPEAGDKKPEDGAAPAPAPADSGLSAAQIEQLRANDSVRRYQQAESLARFVDFVPDVSKFGNDQFAKFNIANNEGSLSRIWERLLRNSQVAQSSLTDAEKKKIEKLRGLLQVKKQKKSLIDETIVTEVTEPSPVVVAYNEKMAAYQAAALEYNNHRIDALTATNQKAVHDWSLNAKIYRRNVTAAMSDWISNGYKNDVEEIGGYIDQVMARDLTMLKAQYKDDFDKAKLTGIASGSDFYYTALVPSSFAKAAGWTTFRFDKGDITGSQTTKTNSTKWNVEAKASFLGIGSASGSHSDSKEHQEFHGKLNSDQFSLQFDIAQVQIVRPWLAEWFFNSTAWRFDENNVDSQGDMLCDGGSPPKGLLPAYPTSMVFVRNLKLRIGKSKEFSDFISDTKSKSTGGKVGASFGPFSLGGGGSYSSSSGNTNKTWGSSHDDQGMDVPGLQVIGFKCHVLPKSPRPNPKIKEWV